jgi:hypothetical protein
MNRLASIATFPMLFIIGNAHAQNDAQSLAMEHMACVFANAGRIDDLQMDPKELAAKVQPLCHNAHVAAEAAVGVSADQAQKLESDHTLAVVLLFRSRENAVGHPIRPSN